MCEFCVKVKFVVARAFQARRTDCGFRREKREAWPKWFVPIFVLSLSGSSFAQIIIVPKTQVVEPFRNNPTWEDFKTAQFERIKVLGTLVANVWTWLDTLDDALSDYPLNTTFVHFHVQSFVDFFAKSQARLTDSNPYAIMDPAEGIHTLETLYRLSNLPADREWEHIRVKWMAIDKMALTVHLYFNETTNLLLANDPIATKEVLKIPNVAFTTWLDEGQNGSVVNWTVTEIMDYISNNMQRGGPETHMLRGLLTMLTKMVQSNVDMHEELNYYCYGNNEFGVFEDIYDIIADAGLYLTMADMKAFLMDLYYNTYAKFLNPTEYDGNREERLRKWHEMVDRIRKKIDFEYLEGSDYTELPHPPIFKCDKTPKELGKYPSQWGKNITTGISPQAGATVAYDPQGGPGREKGEVGYIDNRRPELEWAAFSKGFHGYVESELVLNPETICKGTCKDYKRPTITCKDKDCAGLRATHCDVADPDCMTASQCPDVARNCIRTSHTVEMCLSGDESRYLDYLNYVPDRVFGKGNSSDPRTCSGPMKKAKERWEMEFNIILSGPQYCELCFCTCMSPQNPADQHYVDLQPQMADVAGGYVVSAVRFLQEDHVMRLAIEQGKPLKGGDIDLESTSWVAAPPPDKSDPTKTLPLGLQGFIRMNVDIITAEAHEVVTGVQFKFQESDKSLALQVQVTPISWPANDPTQIGLKDGDSKWIEAQEYPGLPKQPFHFDRPNNPLVQEGPSMPDMVYNSYVEFTVTDYDLDLGQSVIPYFDVQPVHHYDTKRWLQGVGIMHKGKPNSGGFLSPLVVPSKGKKSAE